MDCSLNLEFLCRVCAANTKGKNSVAECVYILKTPGLRDKLDKFLYLKIFDNDALPKVLCKSCFRQVEATASLSKIAKHTQQVFRDFLLSSLPKGKSDPKSNTTSEFTSSDFLSKKDAEKTPNTESTLTPASATSLSQLASTPPPPPPLQTLTANTTPRKDEVVVNVSVSDPLTRENQQKVISNSQRRHSIMIDASNIASFTAAQSIPIPASISQKSTGNSRKSSSPARVVQFCPIAPKTLHAAPISQTSTQITTFSSGGYVIGPVKPSSATPVAVTTIANPTASAEKDESKKSNISLATNSGPNIKDNNILQQKRKNLVKALNNIKANTTGQVSLLKSSQPKQQSALPVEDELPDRIIIAAPKNKLTPNKSKNEENAVAVNNSGPTTSSEIPQPQHTQVQATKTPQLKSNFPDDILLGRVIRDIDLLKLILIALKWPVNKQNMELQLQRLKNSRFTDIMSDSNLLSDTDLTQLLGPYLAPVLMAAQALQQQQQQQVLRDASAAAIPKATLLNKPSTQVFAVPKPVTIDPTAEEINKAIPYKLPPETSVQLVPAMPEETSKPAIASTNSRTLLKRSYPKDIQTTQGAEPAPIVKRKRKAAIQKHRDSIVISDEEETNPQDNKRKSAKQNQKLPTKAVTNFQIDLSNPNFLAQLALINGSTDQPNNALLNLIQQQKVAIPKPAKSQQRRRHSSISSANAPPSTEFDGLINIDYDNIVLVEPATTTTGIAATGEANNAPSIAAQKDIDNFIMPAQVQNSAPIITRPIIKRRKTVIHTSRFSGKEQAMETATATPIQIANEDLKDKQAAPPPELSNVAKHISMQQSQKKDANIEIDLTASTTQLTSKNTSNSTETSPSKQGTRKHQNKSALGQQLLEAIGLQKTNNNTSSLNLHYIPSAAVASNTKQSVQQVRSALKKSLKQAQEQQQLRNKEISSTVSTTVIQDADSTTKTLIKEIIVEGKNNRHTDNSSSYVDVEEQIDTITLVRSQNTTTTLPNTTAMETSKQTLARITERRRTLPSSVGRRRPNLNSKLEKTIIENVKESVANPPNEEQNKIICEKDEIDTLNISSSSVTSSEQAQMKEQSVVTPRRRGRKRLIPLDSAETSTNIDSNKEKDKDNEKVKEIDMTKENDKDEQDAKQVVEKSKTLDKTKEEHEETSSNSGRPTRQSKALSKYYKGPEKTVLGRRSLPARSTRNRKYT